MLSISLTWVRGVFWNFILNTFPIWLLGTGRAECEGGIMPECSIPLITWIRRQIRSWKPEHQPGSGPRRRYIKVLNPERSLEEWKAMIVVLRWSRVRLGKRYLLDSRVQLLDLLTYNLIFNRLPLYSKTTLGGNVHCGFIVEIHKY